MSSVIRIGTVSKVNYEDGTIEVAYEDRDGSVTDEICVVSNALYRMPVVGALPATWQALPPYRTCHRDVSPG